ncbi:hypothetical protein J7T55_009337 [Diaporthe amygdali]|uniref:uncharacterized protein n=1 Tax=Phomopsis amygdali TaxID=1214568 RepID=UPI0022FEE2AB|nr:uncharacterized protein J7T55_009337 [Diaporthe amygdali]KAJ0107373.1 hypothetical protein J7T55_009337 [Diaporthe amygdali]
MKSFVPLIAFLAPVAIMAQTATTTASSASSTCDADYIVEDCLQSTTARQQDCDSQDYTCQCAAYQAIATCYNNCPNDARASTAQGQVTQFCALASQYASTNSVKATGSAAASSGSASATATATDDSSSSSSTSTASSSSSSSSSSANSAADLAISAGGLLAAVAGVMGALL